MFINVMFYVQNWSISLKVVKLVNTTHGQIFAVYLQCICSTKDIYKYIVQFMQKNVIFFQQGQMLTIIRIYRYMEKLQIDTEIQSHSDTVIQRCIVKIIQDTAIQ